MKYKVGVLNIANELGNRSKACAMMSASRDRFNRNKEAVSEGGVDALWDRSYDVTKTKKHFDPAIETAVMDYAVKEPTYGHVRV